MLRTDHSVMDFPATPPPTGAGREGRGPARGVLSIGVGALALTLVVLIVVRSSSTAGTGGGEDGRSAADVSALLQVEVLAPDGSPTVLGELMTGRPLLVNLWASTCTPCITEMPLLERARAENPQLDFVGIAVLDRPERARAMIEQTGVAYAWVQDPTGDFASSLGITTLPITFIVSADGSRITMQHDRAFESRKQLQTWIDEGVQPDG